MIDEPSSGWPLLDALVTALSVNHPRDIEPPVLAREILSILGSAVGARATSIYLADLRGGLALVGTSRDSESHPLPPRIGVDAEAAPITIARARSDAAESDSGDTSAPQPRTEPPPEESSPLDLSALDPSVSLMLAAARRRVPLLIEDVARFRTTEGLREPSHQRPSGNSCIVLPLERGGELHGVINLADLAIEVPKEGTELHHALSAATRWLGQTFASLHAIAELRSLATRDGLTGLYNYATFYDLLAREILRSGRYESPLSLLLMDLDGFKQVNDHYGHLAGDRILSDLAARIRRAKRGPDLAARYAGDEFAVVLPETSRAGAKKVAERIRRLVSDQPFGFLSTEIDATVSIGIAEYKDGMTAVDLVRKADENLYEAKNAGKNASCG